MEVPCGAAAAHEVTWESADFLEEWIMLTRSLCIAMACAVSSVLPVGAHHSHNNYDTAVWTTMEGTVTEVHRLVPHSWIYMDVKDAKGETATWALEGTGPGGLEKVLADPQLASTMGERATARAASLDLVGAVRRAEAMYERVLSR